MDGWMASAEGNAIQADSHELNECTKTANKQIELTQTIFHLVMQYSGVVLLVRTDSVSNEDSRENSRFFSFFHVLKFLFFSFQK